MADVIQLRGLRALGFCGALPEEQERRQPFEVDLDVETLSSLENALETFPGCAVVISHDRWFLDRIATHILAFEGDSHVEFFQGNYREYEEDKKRRLGNDAGPHRLRFKALK